MRCCPLLTNAGHLPYLLLGFCVFCVVILLKILNKLKALIKLMEKK